jgi:hypothetical protein
MIPGPVGRERFSALLHQDWDRAPLSSHRRRRRPHVVGLPYRRRAVHSIAPRSTGSTECLRSTGDCPPGGRLPFRLGLTGGSTWRTCSHWASESCRHVWSETDRLAGPSPGFAIGVRLRLPLLGRLANNSTSRDSATRTGDGVRRRRSPGDTTIRVGSAGTCQLRSCSALAKALARDLNSS